MSPSPNQILAASPHRDRIELLAPAGNWDCVRAAVANGADAVYFGLPRFNARMRADNFREEELPELMQWLHDRGVRGFLTLNVLVFPEELEDVEKELCWAETCGVDALIIQDLGVAILAKTVAPSVALHASTQMTITSPEGVAFAKSIGVDRVVLARETSLRELAKFSFEIMPMEVFVHGALCVAYSGQCLTSEALGQRSANRGECAQACRMPYELIVDNQPVDLGNRRYLLSPQDLAAVSEIPELVRLGVKSFKIEGRLKSPEYVAAICQVYRKAIDASLASQPTQLSPSDRYQMDMTFSRGLSTGWMHGVNHQELVHARFGKKRGPLAGTVKAIGRDHVRLEGILDLRPGDGVVFENPEDTNREEGGRIYEVRGDRFYFGRGAVDLRRIKVGTSVWKTNDPALEKSLRKTFQQDPPPHAHLVDFLITCREGIPLQVRACGRGHQVDVRGTLPATYAHSRPLTAESITAQFARLGGTKWKLGHCHITLEGRPLLPISELNAIRRNAISLLDDVVASSCRKEAQAPAGCESKRRINAIRQLRKPAASPTQPTLYVLCRTPEQIEGAWKAGVRHFYIDFEDIRRYRDVVARLRENHGPCEVYLATPRIQKAGEVGFFKVIEGVNPDGILVRNLGGIGHFSSLPMIGDFSLNTANPLTAALLIERGLRRVTLSYDLNSASALTFLEQVPGDWLEVVLHQHMPMFHMEHCVFAAFLSSGTDHTNCGRPCEKHRVRLRDRIGIEHPLRADVGCRNTLFNAVAQTGALYYEALFAAGARHFRIELLEENAEEARRIASSYQALLSGLKSGRSIWKEVGAQSQFGVTRGTMERDRHRTA